MNCSWKSVAIELLDRYREAQEIVNGEYGTVQDEYDLANEVSVIKTAIETDDLPLVVRLLNIG